MIYAAKCYWPGLTETELSGASSRAIEEADSLSPDGRAVGYVGSIWFPADDLVLCLFETPSRASALWASERAGMPCERIMELRWLPGSDINADSE